MLRDKLLRNSLSHAAAEVTIQSSKFPISYILWLSGIARQDVLLTSQCQILKGCEVLWVSLDALADE